MICMPWSPRKACLQELLEAPLISTGLVSCAHLQREPAHERLSDEKKDMDDHLRRHSQNDERTCDHSVVPQKCMQTGNEKPNCMVSTVRSQEQVHASRAVENVNIKQTDAT
eukprot:5880579-Pleurochrysis_carterae.AAC.2